MDGRSTSSVILRHFSLPYRYIRENFGLEDPTDPYMMTGNGEMRMKGKTHSTEEIIRIFRQADGVETAQSVCGAHNISEQTFYRWKKKYGDMELADAKRLKELAKEDAEKKRLAELMQENRVFKEVNSKKRSALRRKSRLLRT